MSGGGYGDGRDRNGENSGQGAGQWEASAISGSCVPGCLASSGQRCGALCVRCAVILLVHVLFGAPIVAPNTSLASISLFFSFNMDT